jgi:hypothetical protein
MSRDRWDIYEKNGDGIPFSYSPSEREFPLKWGIFAPSTEGRRHLERKNK